jgi:NAD-dependent SIR2 family protein deacetylase
MFECVQCGDRYILEDVEHGRFFPVPSVCLDCYKKMFKSTLTCFGDKERYNMRLAPCQECPDSRVCRVFVFHRKEFRTNKEA